jgi:hypothetical protein
MDYSHSPMRFIAGSGRSGTTWVLDCLAEANDLRPVFEPLHPDVTPVGPRFAYRALAVGNNVPDLAHYLERVNRGEYRSWWINYRGRKDLLLPKAGHFTTWDGTKRYYRRWRRFLSDRSELHAASQRERALIKCIRANLLLGWIVRTFGAQAALIVRHPCAVIESQLRRGSLWDPAPILARFRRDDHLEEISGGRYRALLNADLSLTESLALVWVIENQLPVANAVRDGYTVVSYERLITTPQQEWQRTSGALGLAQAPDLALRVKPSQQSSERALHDEHRPEDKRESSARPKWLDRLSDMQLDQIQHLMDGLACHLYDVRHSEPRY